MQVRPQIFISYAREDLTKAEDLYRRLLDAGFSPWMDKNNILFGEEWHSNLETAIRESDFFLALLSAASVNKKGVIPKEYSIALGVPWERLESGRPYIIIPVRLDDCSVPESLQRHQWLDFQVDDDWTRLIDAIRKHIKRVRQDSTNVGYSLDSSPMKEADRSNRLKSIEYALAIHCGSESIRYIGIAPSNPLLTLHPGVDGTTKKIPAAILYRDILQDKRIFEIGDNALALSFLEEARACTTRNIPRLLGRTERITVQCFNDPDKVLNLSPKEVITDFFGHLLANCERELDGIITRCVIAVPSNLTLRQLEDLKAAFITHGIEERSITTVHEPIAGALSFLLRKEVIRYFDDYTLMVYDMSSESTSIAFLHIKNETDGNGATTIIPEVYGVINLRVGGVHVTGLVAKLAVERCREVIQSRYPDAVLIDIPLKPENYGNLPRKKVARLNRIALDWWAGQAQSMLSRFGDSYSEQSRRVLLELSLSVIIDGVVQIERFFNDEIMPLEVEANDALRVRLGNVREMMKRLAASHHVTEPDMVLLVGQSSANPVVMEGISGAFAKAKIRFPPELRESIVLGASEFLRNDSDVGNRVRFVDEFYEGRTTTSRLGVRVMEAGQLRFLEIIGAGIPIPAIGIKRPIKGLVLRRNSYIVILENIGIRDEIIGGGQENVHIKVIKKFSWGTILAKWEKGHQSIVTDEQLLNATIELYLTRASELKLIAQLPGISESLEFEAVPMELW